MQRQCSVDMKRMPNLGTCRSVFCVGSLGTEVATNSRVVPSMRFAAERTRGNLVGFANKFNVPPGVNETLRSRGRLVFGNPVLSFCRLIDPMIESSSIALVAQRSERYRLVGLREKILSNARK